MVATRYALRRSRRAGEGRPPGATSGVLRAGDAIADQDAAAPGGVGLAFGQGEGLQGKGLAELVVADHHAASAPDFGVRRQLLQIRIDDQRHEFAAPALALTYPLQDVDLVVHRLVLGSGVDAPQSR